MYYSDHRDCALLMGKQFFVYVHHKPNGDPFYVGKGLFKRAYNLKPRNPHHKNALLKYGTDNIAINLFPSESEKAAFRQEVELIAKYKAEGYALTNMTNGGEGVSGAVLTDEVRKKRGAAIKAAFAKNGKKPNPPSQREKARLNALGNKNCVGRRPSEMHRLRLAEASRGNKSALGHVKSDEARARIKAGNLGNKNALGHIKTAEGRAKISATHKGKPWTEARRAACKGKQWTAARHAACRKYHQQQQHLGEIP